MDLEEKIKTAIKGVGVELYDIVKLKENDKNIFRVYITSKDGIDLEKCDEVTKLISPILDLDEPFDGEYFLEVSSPGIERKLKKISHFENSIGENVKIKTNSLQTYKGKLIEVNDNVIKILDEVDEVYEINYKDILNASTYFDWKNLWK